MQLTVVSWNVLASAYVRPEHYPYTPPAVLDRATRDPAVIERLLTHASADVICLQEVEPSMFALANAQLEAHFEGHFLQKVGKPEGCAVFVARALGSPAFRDLVFSDGTGHVAIAAIAGGIGIVSTHLRWQAADVPPEERLGRAELSEVLDQCVTPGVPWIVCGDLNAEAASPVLDVAFARGFRDAYAALPDACTANANGRRKRIDFILHTEDFTAVPAALPAIGDTTPLPSPGEPSDHLAIAASLTRRSLR